MKWTENLSTNLCGFFLVNPKKKSLGKPRNPVLDLGPPVENHCSMTFMSLQKHFITTLYRSRHTAVFRLTLSYCSVLEEAGGVGGLWKLFF